MIGRSRGMRNLKKKIKKVSSLEVPVLIIGETGTGKELVARGIHNTGIHSKGSFIAVDCGAIPENLMESELFGAVKGAYTDSRTDRPGLLEAANGGSLFLDEIGNLPSSLQAKLLRVLETGTIRRLGDVTERKVSFRLISATNTDITDTTQANSFRTDLYYRIAVLILQVPPLRERLDDIPRLTRYFSVQLTETGDKLPVFMNAAIKKLQSYSWPGNIRELKNVVHRAILFSNGSTVREQDIHFENGKSPDNGKLESLEMATAKHVYNVVKNAGNKTQAAQILKCDPKTIRKYLKIYEEGNKK